MAAQGAALQSHNNELVKCEWPSPAIPMYESLSTTRPLDQHAIQLTLWGLQSCPCPPACQHLAYSLATTASLYCSSCTQSSAVCTLK